MKRTALMAVLGWLVLMVSGAPAAEVPTTAPDAMGSPTVIIHLQSEINDYNRDELFKRFAEARQLGAKTVILDIDTYGGLPVHQTAG
jgi:membrane-bound ClpP family serine protease